MELEQCGTEQNEAVTENTEQLAEHHVYHENQANSLVSTQPVIVVQTGRIPSFTNNVY